MSHTRGTKLNWVGRTNARSSRNVERSLFAAKYTVPPAPRAPYSRPRPIMWLIGMKLKVIDGWMPSSPQVPLTDRRHELATRRSGYIAPFGVPVLPEV